MLYQLIITVLLLADDWMIFKKMGHEGWEGIIPFYNLYILFRDLYGNGWKFLLILIPFYNIYLLFKINIDLAHAFNQPTGFGVGMVLLSPIFDTLLAFGKYQYRDGSSANRETDFVSKAADAVGNAFRTTPASHTCPGCGKEFDVRDAYCPYCGMKYQQPEKKYCPGCGALMKDGDTFCPGCGRKVR